MSEPHVPDPVLLVVAAFSRHGSALDWARARLVESFGRLGLESPEYALDQTCYYEPVMVRGLRKRLLAFRELVAPARLAEIKRRTNELEAELARGGGYAEPRP